MDNDEVALPGGNLTAVVRVGNTVRRATGPWTPAVHALLKHLETVGFEGAPRVLGFDERGREIQKFVEGVPGGYPMTEELSSDRCLAGVARLVRRYHEAVEGFVPPEGARWRVLPGTPEGKIICHNDLSPYNTIYREGRPAVFVDWDLAAPSVPEWDVAYALWRFVPLYPDFQPVEVSARRIGVLLEAYGGPNRSVMREMVLRRMRATVDALMQWAAHDPAFARMVRDGHADGQLRDIAFVERHGELWE